MPLPPPNLSEAYYWLKRFPLPLPYLGEEVFPNPWVDVFHTRIGPVAVAHGNLAVRVETRVQVSQPPPLAPRGSTTVVVPESQVQAQEQGGQVHLLPAGASIGDVVAALNALGATPRDLIAILQAIQRAGALDADLELL